MDDAKGVWDTKKSEAEKALLAAKTPLETVTKLRTAVTDANNKLKGAKATSALKEKAIKAANVVVKGKVDALMKATTTCVGLKYDKFSTDMAQKKADRDSTLKAIEKMIDARKTFAHGVTGGRCEKPASNGDWLKRGKCAAETDCCGAATGRPNGATGALVTIEVCQEKASKTYGYVAPRAPLAKTDPVAVNWPFACIGGASQLAGAAAAVLASAYMMA